MEYIATGHLSEALRDRFEHLPLLYQPEADEIAIVAAITGSASMGLVTASVRLARATREHPRFRKGASIRAAIAMVHLAERLAHGRPDGLDRAVLRRAAMAALATRVELRDDQGANLATVLDELLGQAGTAFGDGGPPPDANESDTANATDATDAPGPDAGREDLPPIAVVPFGDDAPAARRPKEAEDGWLLAAGLTAGTVPDANDTSRARAEHLAVAAVLRRAAVLVGPLRGATRLERGPQREPGEGELDVEATLENALGKRRPEADDWIVERRTERRRQVVLMIDGSGSMAGENMALGAVAVAVLAMKLHPGDLAIIAFADDERVLVRLGEQVPAHEAVRRLLHAPCRGATNIAAGLEAGAAEVAAAGDPRCAAVLISDGLYTAGPDPRTAAARFGSLQVLHTSAVPAGSRSVWIAPWRQAGRDIAEHGGGRAVPVATFAELPSRMLALADHMLR